MAYEEGALRWIEQLDPAKRAEAIRESFAKVAATQEGKVVFAEILQEARLFRPAKNDEERAWCEFAKHLLRTYFGENAVLRVFEALTARSD